MTVSLQQYADEMLAPEYKQPLKTIEDACRANGWDFVDKPECCGASVEIHSFIGAYYAECKVCGLFVRDISAPQFGNGSAFCLDPNKVDMCTEVRWIAGKAPLESKTC